MPNKLLIRVDANEKIGTGHFMRCLALAQAWMDDGGEVEFVTNRLIPAIENRVKKEHINIRDINVVSGSPSDAKIILDLAKIEKVAWIVTDGQIFGSNYQKMIKEKETRLLCIDDIGSLKHYYADIILNQNLHAAESLYANRESYTHLLLGLKFVLLRREFLQFQNYKKNIPNVARKILVTLGGIDIHNGTRKVIQSLQGVKLDRLEVKVIVGAGNANYKLLLSAVKNFQYPIHVEYNTDVIANIMRWADLTVCSGGTTVWELAFMGIPALVMITTPIEEKLAEGIKKQGLFYNLGRVNELSLDKISSAIEELITNNKTRINMSRLGRKLVDGYGCRRVILRLKNEK